ncbi:alpha/beta hydrolase family protein [Deinococcus cellulosilyticus]|uniref:Alpha/beta hydrolase n=1 Tax=Deinococcus cellulosilyticus (strain DSM 18568 / NBRC 106333 / KACC 11606 / 5516J-15) TaxID=1223518 RepID=A0A511N3P1_DEIC1|nr:alpha/beta fold hydrolase [Deinococcus cellulosilyticus]GEM47490.1 alpha/beta hydrolase [Deinococcus cellulosilyticus NBRC 106333 = KACC 11606]
MYRTILTTLVLTSSALAASENLSLPSGGFDLKGTLQLPEGTGPFPVALIIAGSGPTDRDGNNPLAGKNNSLKLLAEGLAQNGIASLRYDKRGIGESAKADLKEEDQRFDDFIQDASNWLDLLKKDGRFNRYFVLGHSEGALIGLAVAKQNPVDRYVSISGTGSNAADILLTQLKPQLPAPLFDASADLIAKLRKGETGEMPDPALASLFRPSVQPYLISWFKHDPAALIAGLNTPTLIVQGARDLQVTVADAQKLHAAQPKAQLLILPTMNHVLKSVSEDPQDNLAAYSNPDLPLSDGLLQGIVEFLK